MVLLSNKFSIKSSDHMPYRHMKLVFRCTSAVADSHCPKWVCGDLRRSLNREQALLSGSLPFRSLLIATESSPQTTWQCWIYQPHTKANISACRSGSQSNATYIAQPYSYATYWHRFEWRSGGTKGALIQYLPRASREDVSHLASSTSETWAWPQLNS